MCAFNFSGEESASLKGSNNVTAVISNNKQDSEGLFRGCPSAGGHFMKRPGITALTEGHRAIPLTPPHMEWRVSRTRSGQDRSIRE